jgi:hypothetical protein
VKSQKVKCGIFFVFSCTNSRAADCLTYQSEAGVLKIQFSVE